MKTRKIEVPRFLKRILLVVLTIYLTAGVYAFGLSWKSDEPFHGLLCYSDGPYKGKVIDFYTKMPIEGAVIAGSWSVERAAFYPSFCDAVEAVTDKNGQFLLPRAWCINLWPIGNLNVPADIVVFKPGYLAYPPFGSTEADRKKHMPGWNSPRLFESSNQDNIVELGKPDTAADRMLTNNTVHGPLAYDRAYNKLPVLLRLINEDRKSLGLQGEIGLPKRGGH